MLASSIKIKETVKGIKRTLSRSESLKIKEEQDKKIEKQAKESAMEEIARVCRVHLLGQPF